MFPIQINTRYQHIISNLEFQITLEGLLSKLPKKMLTENRTQKHFF